MAEKNEELEQIKQMTSAEQMLESIEGRADPFAGYTLEELQSIAGVINGFGDSKAKEAVVAMLKAEIDKQQNNQQPQGQEQPTPADAQEQQPATSEAPVQDNLKDLEFITEPSYSQYKAFESLHSAALQENNNLSNDDIMKMTNIINNAQKAVDSVVDGEITPESAVSLKDYINILRDARTFEADEKEKMDALETKVNAQLKIFDEENGLDKLEGVSAEELEEREDTLHQIATSRLKAKFINKDTSSSELEDYEIIKNLAIQEMKTSSIYPDEKLYKEIAESIGAGATPKDIEDIFNKGISGAPLSDVQQEVYDTLRKEVIRDKAAEFDEKFEELKEQFEATKAIERIKLSAEELYPEKEGMSPEELEQQRRKREEYLQEQLQREGGLPSQEEWIEENALRALKGKHQDEEISDEELLRKYGKEFDKLKQDYTNVAEEINTSTKVAYVTKVDLIANRSARITKSPDINPNTKTFLQDFAKNNPKSYALGKAALTVGKTLVVTQAIRYAAGFKGMAVYSAYTTHKAIKKSWAKYKEQAQANGQKANLAGYWGYLKEHKEERADLIGKVAKTAIMSTLAIAGTAAGIDNIPGVSAALVGVTNAATSTAKFAYKLKDFKNKNPKATKWGLIGAGVAALGTAAVAGMHFLPEETKEKIGGFFSGLAEKIGLKDGNDDMTDLDKKLLAESDGQGMDAAQREQIENFGKPKENDGGVLTLDKLQKTIQENQGTENGAADTPEGNTNASDATQATAEVPALSEADVKLMVTDCKMGPDPIVAKLQQMGVLSDEDKEKLIGSGGRKDGVASRVLASYLGHPYDNTEVPVHANLTPEQQQELNQFLRSDEYQQQCDKCNAADNARRIASLRSKINGDENIGGGGNGNSNGFHLEGNQNNGTPVETKYTFEVSQRKKAIFNIVNKSMNPEQTSVDLSTMYTKEQLSQMTPEQIEKASMQAAAYKYIQEHGVKRAEIVDKDGNVHTYYREDMKRDGDVVTKRVDRTTDGDKVTTKVRTSGNGATLVKYSGKEEQVTYTDEHGNKVNIGGEGEDKVKRVVVDPTTGKEYTLVKGDDGKMYTLEKDLRTGQTTVSQGGSKRQLNQVFKEVKKQNIR